jgi:hypothetical protein
MSHRPRAFQPGKHLQIATIKYLKNISGEKRKESLSLQGDIQNPNPTIKI